MRERVMISYFTEAFTRPADADPNAPKGFAIGVVVAFIAILVLPTVGLIFAFMWGLTAVEAIPDWLAKTSAYAVAIALLAFSAPLTMHLYWKVLRDDS